MCNATLHYVSWNIFAAILHAKQSCLHLKQPDLLNASLPCIKFSASFNNDYTVTHSHSMSPFAFRSFQCDNCEATIIFVMQDHCFHELVTSHASVTYCKTNISEFKRLISPDSTHVQLPCWHHDAGHPHSFYTVFWFT